MTAPGDHLAADSITTFGAEARGRTVLAASHAGVYACRFAAHLGLAAVIMCDAGVGRDRAGIAGLDYLQRCGIAAATVGHRTARIGDAADCIDRGLISYANECAKAFGVAIGMRTIVALSHLREVPCPEYVEVEESFETRRCVLDTESGRPAVWLLDSASLVSAADHRAIVVTGSHGGLLGGRPETAIKEPVLAAIYNDADRGIDDAGLSRLHALDRRAIAAATVSAWTASIGDASSTYEQGIISAVNATAISVGAEVGVTTIEFVNLLREAFRGKTSR